MLLQSNSLHLCRHGDFCELMARQNWLRDCDLRRDMDGEAYLQLEYQEDDELMVLLQHFLEESRAQKQLVKDLYQIWQQTVLSTLLASSALWKKESVQSSDQRFMKDQLKLARYKINFIMHHTIGSMLSSSDAKWKQHVPDLLQLVYQTLQLLPRLAESCPHHKTDMRQTIIHFEGKEFLAAVACESWDTLYDFSIPIDPEKFIPILRRCAMLDILDKDWNMLGGWEDVLKGLEARCCLTGPVLRLPCDSILHDQTTILRNARNSMQCKFFSVRFMRYTEDQAPQRWKYFAKCSAPACGHVETPQSPHSFRCQSCWYFHYCSEACMEYCDNIMGLHHKFCKDTPPAKAALCKRETEQYLGWAGAAAADASTLEHDVLCHACGVSERLLSESGSSKMKSCGKCQSVFYCSKQCASWDWRIGGHQQSCSISEENGTTTTAETDETTNHTNVVGAKNSNGATAATSGVAGATAAVQGAAEPMN
ncbi:hypothetical protein MPSEU_000790000 [Mayamaea pseudoterrestris]|nr:hypothetical protein MPSEU_000790000 [Mayamaea pseudoterrestris]